MKLHPFSGIEDSETAEALKTWLAQIGLFDAMMSNTNKITFTLGPIEIHEPTPVVSTTVCKVDDDYYLELETEIKGDQLKLTLYFMERPRFDNEETVRGVVVFDTLDIDEIVYGRASINPLVASLSRHFHQAPSSLDYANTYLANNPGFNLFTLS